MNQWISTGGSQRDHLPPTLHRHRLPLEVQWVLKQEHITAKLSELHFTHKLELKRIVQPKMKMLSSFLCHFKLIICSFFCGKVMLKVPYCTPFWSFILGFDVLKNIYLRYKYQKPSQYTVFLQLFSQELC